LCADVRFPTSLTGDGTDAMYADVLSCLAALHEIPNFYTMTGTPIATIPLPTSPFSLPTLVSQVTA